MDEEVKSGGEFGKWWGYRCRSVGRRKRVWHVSCTFCRFSNWGNFSALRLIRFHLELPAWLFLKRLW